IALSARGEKVAVHYGRRREEAERTLAALHGDGHVLVGGDLSDPETAERVVEEAVAGLGQVDVLVNNAGIAPGPGTDHRVGDVDLATWQRRVARIHEVDIAAPADQTSLVAR